MIVSGKRRNKATLQDQSKQGKTHLTSAFTKIGKRQKRPFSSSYQQLFPTVSDRYSKLQDSPP
jgi:hypothetical protein